MGEMTTGLEREGPLSQQQGLGAVERLVTEDNALLCLLLLALDERSHPGLPTANYAFVEFVRRTQHRLARKLLPLLRGDVHRTEDVVQETFLKVWKALPKFAPHRLGKGGVFAWLVKIAQNTAISQGRRKRPATDADFGPPTPDGSPRLPEPECPDADPSLQAQINEREVSVHDAIRQLHPSKQTVLRLHYHEDKSHKEIAELCGLTLGQVNMMLYSARQEIRARVENYVVGDRE
jgi:RNA polymerase sigma-70 factor (ECF subfamily)